MTRTVCTETFNLPVEEMPKSLIATTFSGHMLEIDVNRYNGRVFVKYPINEESLKLVSRIFQLLDVSGFLENMILQPEKLIGTCLIVADSEEEAVQIRRECRD